jgi:hypothetical protein
MMLSRGKQFISTLILIVGFALAPSAALSGPDVGQLECNTVQQYLDKQVQILLDDNVLSMYLLKETFIDKELPKFWDIQLLLNTPAALPFDRIHIYEVRLANKGSRDVKFMLYILVADGDCFKVGRFMTNRDIEIYGRSLNNSAGHDKPQFQFKRDGMQVRLWD